MATKREVEFVISARNQAKAALDSIAASLKSLSGAQAQVGATSGAAQAGLNRLGNAAQRATAVLATRQGRPFLGLRPYELQNLSFQINDLFTQIASGTSVTQAFAQQSGQIAQIFPKFIAGMLRALPLIAAVTLALAPLIAAFQRISGIESDTRTFNRALAATADAARATGAELAETARRLNDVGFSADDARDSVRTFLDAGFDPTQFERLSLTAQNLAEVLGVEIPEAAEKLAEGFGDDFDAVVDLDQALNFLTFAQREQLQAMADSGREAEAISGAFAVLEERLSDGAEEAVGWAAAFREVGTAWNDMVTAIADSELVREATEAISADVEQLARNFQSAIAQITGASANEISQIQRGVRIVTNTPNAPGAPLVDPQSEAERKRIQDEARAEAERAAREAEREAERAAEARADFQQHLSDLEFEATLIGQSAERQEVLTALREAQRDAQEAGVTLSQQELDNLEAQIVAVQERAAAEEDAVNAKRKNAEAEAEAARKNEEIAEEAARRVEQIRERIAGGLTDAIFDAIDGTQSLGDAFRQFAADFLREIARMIIQQQILNAVKAAGSAFGVSGFHSGGIVGSARPKRQVSPGLFSNALRYHGGGIAGLRPGEVPAILKRNEEVLSEDNPRNALNGGGAQRAPDVTINNLIDAGEFVSKGLGTREGEQAVMNFITSRRTAVRAAIGV